MYKAFFGLKENPFNLSPDPHFLYRSPQHEEALANLTGIVPKIIAYPNGNTSQEIMNECRTLGLTFGVTDKGYKNHLPLDGQSVRSLQLGRFVLTQYQSELRHFETLRSDIQPKKQFKALLCRKG